MSRLSASGFATAIAIALVVGMGVAEAPSRATFTRAALPVEAADSIPNGRCQIQYESLPEARQPAHMECEHAHWLARVWGGRVMEKTETGLVEAAAYEGRNDFTGVPAEALPRAGYCRAWLDGASIDMQPAQTDCRTARRIAERDGGRVLFMPL
jgi:hypothetical protein